MTIPVEQIGLERERIPALLVKIESNIGVIKYSSDHSTVLRVPLSELQLAQAAYEPVKPPSDSASTVSEVSPQSADGDAKPKKFATHEPVEIWMANEVTNRLSIPRKAEGGENAQQQVNGGDGSESTQCFETENLYTGNCPVGAWWPGRILSFQRGLVHVEVAAPLADDDENTLTSNGISANVARVGSSLPYRPALVQLDHIRRPWPGRQVSPVGQSALSGDPPTKESAPVTLLTPGVLHRHTICIPAYLSRLASSADAHTHLVKFCGAPCLMQCAPEPFLPSMFLKRVLTDGGGEIPKSGNAMTKEGQPTTTSAPGELPESAGASSTVSWASGGDGVSSLSCLPVTLSVPGTLSSAGVTDPALLLEGLPGVNGPLVFLYIWSGSAEAIRRTSLLELAYVKLLVFRYHVLRKMSKGEPGELDVCDSVDSAAENGEAPFLHCKPISIPVNPNDASDGDGHVSTTTNTAAPTMMIGYSAQFRIQLRLIGLAIGHHGSTIQEARKLPGVRSVSLLQDGIVQVEAVSVEACQSVRNLLDYTEAEVPVSPRLASRLIGSKGENIRKLAASAGVRRAELLGPLERQRRQQASAGDREVAVDVGNGNQTGSEKLPQPAFYLLGTRPAVAKMRLLLEFQADNWNELDELEEARRTLVSKLRQSTQTASRSESSVGGPRMNGAPPTAGSQGPRRSGRWVDSTPEHPNQGPYPGRFRGRGSLMNGGGRGGIHFPNNRLRQQSGGSAEPDSSGYKGSELTCDAPNEPADGHRQPAVPQQITGNRGRGRGGGSRRRLPSSGQQQQTVTATQ